MKRLLFWFLILATLVLLLWGGTRTWQRQQAHTAALAQDNAAQQNVRLQLGADEVLTVRRRSLPVQVAVSGTVRPLDRVSVKAQASGQVLGLQVREGERVRKGQPLFRIAAQDASARLQQASQQAQAALAEQQVAQRNAANSRALAQQGFISPTALTNAESSLQAAQASYRAALAGVEVARKGLSDTSAASPLDGVVAARHVQPEEVAAAGAAVLDIVDLRAFELHGTVSAQDSIQVRTGQQASLLVEGAGQSLAAEVVRVSPSAQEGSRAIAVYLRIAPPAAAAPLQLQLQLRDGLFARGSIATGAVDAVAIPQTALRTDKPQPYVLLLENGVTVRHQPVRPGTRSLLEGTVWQAVEDLPEGAQILAHAAGLLEDGTQVQVAQAAGAAEAR